jgi:hypothetical protein
MPGAAVRRVLASFERLSHEDQVALLTLPLLLLYTDDYWYTNIPIGMLALAGLLFPTVRRSPLLWFAIACFLAAGIVWNWSSADNHTYLMCYWCLAISCTFASDRPHVALQQSARWLIAVTFAFAVLWKLLSADFLNASFFHYALLFDPRLNSKLELAGLLTSDSVALNAAAQLALVSYDSQLTRVGAITTEGVVLLAQVMTWWTVAIEAFIAVGFAAPAGSRLAKGRHACLLLFILTTYAIAPVIGFGWILATMAFVDAGRDDRSPRALYLVCIVLLQVFRAPWSSIYDAVAPLAGGAGT